MHSTMLLTLACLNVYFVKTGSLIPCTLPVFGIFFKNLLPTNQPTNQLTTNAFFKVSLFVSTKTKQNSFGLFSPVHTDAFSSYENAYFLTRFRPSSTVRRPKTLKETTVYDSLFRPAFKSLLSYLSTLETERFHNDAFSKDSTFKTVFESLRFHQHFRSF